MSTVPSEAATILPPWLLPGVDPDIDYEALITEDHKPMDNYFVEKQYRLLTHSLFANWVGPGAGRPFLVQSNVGWFYQLNKPAVVPDILLSLDVTCPANVFVKSGHSYYQWLVGKAPDVLIEAVSDRRGDEEAFKKDLYARLGVPYYAIFDPLHFLSTDTLQTYELVAGEYRLTSLGPWPKVGLGLRLWRGAFEGVEVQWLRWCDAHGALILTGEESTAQEKEQAAQEKKRADQEKKRADQEKKRADQEKKRADQEKKRADQADKRIRLLEDELRRSKGETST